MLPMLDDVIVISVSGKDLLGAFENGVCKYPALEGRFPQVSGCAFGFDPAREPGSRVVWAKVGGEDLDPDRHYRLAIKAFLAEGKDGYSSLMNSEVVVDAEESPQLTTMILNFFTKMRVMAGLTSKRNSIHLAIEAFKSPAKHRKEI